MIHKLTGTVVPLNLTIFQPYSWVAVIVVLVLLALAIRRMEPAQPLEPDPAVFEDEEPVAARPRATGHLPNGWKTCGFSTSVSSPPGSVTSG
ncbi:short-chain fatty acids transporter domain protein [Mycobacterium kansasii]|uniref:Short-chain fatty acids transporter domain protein n=1 Tax=Mycobacterium kansasii TaxID=1768 RepID=A0A1V3XG81_MYCKA|nr:short-chain fatty acids transporter domain protein [Mycobacterium kansasii]